MRTTNGSWQKDHLQMRLCPRHACLLVLPSILRRLHQVKRRPVRVEAACHSPTRGGRGEESVDGVARRWRRAKGAWAWLQGVGSWGGMRWRGREAWTLRLGERGRGRLSACAVVALCVISDSVGLSLRASPAPCVRLHVALTWSGEDRQRGEPHGCVRAVRCRTRVRGKSRRQGRIQREGLPKQFVCGGQCARRSPARTRNVIHCFAGARSEVTHGALCRGHWLRQCAHHDTGSELSLAFVSFDGHQK